MPNYRVIFKGKLLAAFFRSHDAIDFVKQSRYNGFNIFLFKKEGKRLRYVAV